MNKYYKISSVSFADNSLIINIDGDDMSFSLKEISKALLKASEKERNTYEVSPSGYGIYWPLIDEDLSIDGLLGIEHKPKKKLKSA